MGRLYTLRDWAWDMERLELARWIARHRPLIGFNRALEAVTNG